MRERFRSDVLDSRPASGASERCGSAGLPAPPCPTHAALQRFRLASDLRQQVERPGENRPLGDDPTGSRFGPEFSWASIENELPWPRDTSPRDAGKSGEGPRQPHELEALWSEHSPRSASAFRDVLFLAATSWSNFEMRAFDFVCPGLGPCRIHSSSWRIAVSRPFSSRSSCSRRLAFFSTTSIRALVRELFPAIELQNPAHHMSRK